MPRLQGPPLGPTTAYVAASLHHYMPRLQVDPNTPQVAGPLLPPLSREGGHVALQGPTIRISQDALSPTYMRVFLVFTHGH